MLACAEDGAGAFRSYQTEDGSERPIAFASRRLSHAETNYSQLDKEDGCIMRGCQLIVPEPWQATTLQLLHSSHSGVVKMKALARSYIWWPCIDVQIERIAQHCGQCEENARQPTRAQLRPWLFPQEPWSRAHLDYAGPIENRKIFVAVDS